MELIIGSAQLSGSYGVLEQSVESSGDVAEVFLKCAVHLGFSAVDTAPAYPGSEQAIAKANVELSVHTKFDPLREPEQSIRDSLMRLERDFVEVAYFHDPLAVLVEGGVAVARAAALIGQEVGLLGSSVYEIGALRASLRHSLIGVVQIPVNPLNRACVNFATQFGKNEKKIFGRSLLNQGLLTCEFEQIPSQLSHLWPTIYRFRQVCAEIGRSPSEAALLWSRDHRSLDGVVIGAASIRQLQEASEVLRKPGLTEEERRLIDMIDQPRAADLDPRSWK